MKFYLTAFLSFGLILSSYGQSRADRVTAKLAENPKANWWEVVDSGPFQSDTYRIFGKDGGTGVLKGIALKIGAEEENTVVFDTETMRMVAGFSGNVSFAGTPWNGSHGGNSYMPEDRAKYYFTTGWGPGWGVDGNLEDPREKDNGIPNGPLPDEHAEYLGIYRHEGGSVLSYEVGGVPVLERPTEKGEVLFRSFRVGKRKLPLQLVVSDPIEKGRVIEAKLIDAPAAVKIEVLDSGRRIVTLPPSAETLTFHLAYVPEGIAVPELAPLNWESLTSGGPSLFPDTIEVSGQVGDESGTYATDTIPLPTRNPWKSEVRFGAFDIFPDGKRAACSTWNGDVWIADGIDGALDKITWRRFASGLYQTLGLKIVDGIIHTMGRDQITRLHDLNEDGEADFYECFNNDVNITDGFHEFAFDLRTDEEGNFYFSKGQPVLAGGRGFAPWTEHNGTIMKVSADGEKLERLAWGLRAPGGLGLGPNGELTTGENEGSYVPRCKITWSKRPDLGRGDDISFHGVVPSVWEEKAFVKNLPGAPTDYERPLLWLPYYVDNSSGSQYWVPEDSAWENHAGNMLHLSYGKSSVLRVLIDEVDGQVQGGVYRLPIELTSAAMRGRFHPESGHLYLIGFRGWQTNGGTGFHRVRKVGKEKPVPVGLRAHKNGMVIEFSEAIDAQVASDPRRYAVTKWDYVWGPQYGSGRFSIDNYDDEARIKALDEISKGWQNQVDTVPVRAATLLEDGKSVFLYVEKMTPAMQMEIKMDLATTGGDEFRETIWNTIHNLRPDFDEHGLDFSSLPDLDTSPVGTLGLILSMAHGSTDDALVVDRLAITLDNNQAATPFIDPRRGREMVFEGNLVIEARDKLAFHLEGTGWASLRIDGKTLIEGELPLSAEPIEMEAGTHAIFCNFRRTDGKIGNRDTGGLGRLQLLWSGEQFVKEPVPPRAFRHLPNAVVEAKDKTRHGRELFASVGCIRCHKAETRHVDPKLAMPELLESLPDFENIGHRLNPGWVEKWVRQPSQYCPSVAPDDAPHIAAALAARQKEPLTGQPGDATKGEAIASQLHLKPWADKLIGESKYTPAGLVSFLMNPTAHHSDTRFPDLRLSRDEAANLASWILDNQPEAPAATGGDPERGEEMIAKRCDVCHAAGDKKASYEFAALPLSQMWKEEWLVRGCLSEEEGNAPELGLSLEAKQALLAFRNVDSNHGLNSLNRLVPHEYAKRTMKRLQCAECHSGENQLPGIEQAGEKLRDEWLAGLFKGEVLQIRPYQQARMPGFPSRAEALAKGIAHGAGVSTGEKLTAPDQPLADVGGKIAGATGYACTTCHAVGSEPAVQAFEGQGPNLQLAGERLREDYYQAWMHWPQRFVPTTIMPKYTLDKTHALNPAFFEGSSGKQFEAVWQWMKTLEGAEKAPVTESH